MIVGLCSSYNEGRLAASAVRSLLDACDKVIVAEGPIAGSMNAGTPTDWRQFKKDVLVMRGEWESDAIKRTMLLHRAQQMYGTNLKWGVILDGDELLVDGRFLPEYFDALHPDAIGFSLHLMELDGSCSYIPNRVLRLDRIRRWTLSSYAFELDTGVIVQRGNMPILQGGEPEPLIARMVDGEWDRIPEAWLDTGDGVRQRRRPLAGEPHILHRSVLRSPERQKVRRLSDAEAETISGLSSVRDSILRK